MIKVKRIDPRTRGRDRDGAARDLGALFGLCPGAREHVATQATDVAFLHPVSHPVSDDGATATALEIIAPAADSGNPGLTRFLDQRGQGLHHICFEVDDYRLPSRPSRTRRG